eukprot:m.263824 g.263824  ORF g.263824 m.263824 type:complete len:555 (+) comp17614_c0_seq1:145-1809(+)
MLDLLPCEVLQVHIFPLLNLADMSSMYEVNRYLHDAVATFNSRQWAWRVRPYLQLDQPMLESNSFQELVSALTLRLKLQPALAATTLNLDAKHAEAEKSLRWFAKAMVHLPLHDARLVLLAAALGAVDSVQNYIANDSDDFLTSCEWHGKSWLSFQSPHRSPPAPKWVVLETAGRVACRQGNEAATAILARVCQQQQLLLPNTRSTLAWFLAACRSNNASLVKGLHVQFGIEASFLEAHCQRHYAMGFNQYWLHHSMSGIAPLTTGIAVAEYLLHMMGLIGNDDARRGLLLDAIFASDGGPLAAYLLEAYAMADQFATAADLASGRRRSLDAVRGRNLLGFPGQRRRSSAATMAVDEAQAAMEETLMPPLPGHALTRLLTLLVRHGDVESMQTYQSVYGHSLKLLLPKTALTTWRAAALLASKLGHTEMAEYMNLNPVEELDLDAEPTAEVASSSPRRVSAPAVVTPLARPQGVRVGRVASGEWSRQAAVGGLVMQAHARQEIDDDDSDGSYDSGGSQAAREARAEPETPDRSDRRRRSAPSWAGRALRKLSFV